MYGINGTDSEVKSESLSYSFPDDFINKLTDKLNSVSDAGKVLSDSIIKDNISLKDTINYILNNPSLSDPSSGITNSAVFKQLLGQFITETMRLTPKDVGTPGDNPINSFYKRVRKILKMLKAYIKAATSMKTYQKA